MSFVPLAIDALRALFDLMTSPPVAQYAAELGYRIERAERVRALFCRSTIATFDDGSTTTTSDDEDLGP